MTGRMKAYVNGTDITIQSGKVIMDEMIGKVSIDSIIFLQISKLLFNQCLQDGPSSDALKYGELCRSAYRSQTQLNPLGNLQTLVKLTRLQKSCGIEFEDLVEEIMEIEIKYFQSNTSSDINCIRDLIKTF